ncbi:MAG TPA: hypothetical protein PKH80_05780 [Methanofastidiosum sp.]|nr:hypothetical protein [Methanofastidiosum sp.]HNU61537.1 hypothetical protein [Methanofastidiosum sp.]
MESVTNKILDNTVISVLIRDILSCSIIEICSQVYPLVTSKEVFHETSKYPDKNKVSKIYTMIKVLDNEGDTNYKKLLAYLESRYPYLHKGELSTLLVAILNYELVGRKYYYVTDDGRMRKTLPKITQDTLFLDILGKSLNKINLTGTIGLIKRLFDKGMISPEEIESIIVDLGKGDFYITPELLNHLRGKS